MNKFLIICSLLVVVLWIACRKEDNATKIVSRDSAVCKRLVALPWTIQPIRDSLCLCVYMCVIVERVPGLSMLHIRRSLA